MNPVSLPGVYVIGGDGKVSLVGNTTVSLSEIVKTKRYLEAQKLGNPDCSVGFPGCRCLRGSSTAPDRPANMSVIKAGLTALAERFPPPPEPSRPASLAADTGNFYVYADEIADEWVKWTGTHGEVWVKNTTKVSFSTPLAKEATFTWTWEEE